MFAPPMCVNRVKVVCTVLAVCVVGLLPICRLAFGWMGYKKVAKLG